MAALEISPSRFETITDPLERDKLLFDNIENVVRRMDVIDERTERMDKKMDTLLANQAAHQSAARELPPSDPIEPDTKTITIGKYSIPVPVAVKAGKYTACVVVLLLLFGDKIGLNAKTLTEIVKAVGPLFVGG